jgi:hypothetical protein
MLCKIFLKNFFKVYIITQDVNKILFQNNQEEFGT